MGSEMRTPGLLWAQRRHMLYVFVKIPDLQPGSVVVNVTDQRLQLTARSEAGGAFELSLDYFRRIESRTSSWRSVEHGVLSGVQLTLPKFWEWRYWPRLTSDDGSKLSIAVDWKRWKRDDTEDVLTKVPEGEDEDWWDDEVAAAKAPNFPDDALEAAALPLLTAATFEAALEAADMTVVVFFDRAMSNARVTRSTVRALAAIARLSKGVNTSVACVDIAAEVELARMFHVQRSPAVKLLFADGEMFDVNMNPLKTAKLLLQFIVKQRQPAVEAVTSIAGAAAVFRELDRVLVLVHDGNTSSALTGAFDLAAKEWRSDSIGLVLKHVSLHRNVLAQLRNLNESRDPEPWVPAALDALGAAALDRDFTGIVMAKYEEDAQVYGGPPTKRNLRRWALGAQINLIEPMSTASLQYIRSFKAPILYVILNQTEVSAAAYGELRAIRATAARFKGQVFFMWGIADVHASIVAYLKCKNHGYTYAVLEDQVEDYKYCLEADAKRELTTRRVSRLLDEYVQNRAKPDNMDSERVPAVNSGPVYKVVGKNLMDVAMNASRDVVLHIYSDADDKWQDDAFTLEKVAKDLEDVATVYIGKLDGLKNQPSPDFPDLGYFPCTWMFPAHHKSRPLMFNATLGFTYDRLITWVQKTADIKFELDDEMVEKRLRDLGADGGSTDGVSFEELEMLYVEEQKARVRSKKARRGKIAVADAESHPLDFNFGASGDAPLPTRLASAGSSADAAGSNDERITALDSPRARRIESSADMQTGVHRNEL